ncbi:hypothetical protein ACPYO6_10450 [Georgenia sp. Z1344]|uniref:hypothetical protein n=1 Tax=Georgenia sp. Z1344 TaxID=3416706 RepID=UPI003CEE2BF9
MTPGAVVAGGLAGPWSAGAETPTGELQPWDVSPGIEGFFAFFALAAVVVALGFLVVRQMRRVDQNARVRAAQEAKERSEADGGAGVTEAEQDAPRSTEAE